MAYGDGLREEGFGWFLVQIQDENADIASEIFRKFGYPWILGTKEMTVSGLRRYLCDAENNSLSLHRQSTRDFDLSMPLN